MTVWPIQRPDDGGTDEQRLFYSGKHHDHVVKYTLLIDERRSICFVSQLYDGHLHDKTIADACFKYTRIKNNVSPGVGSGLLR